MTTDRIREFLATRRPEGPCLVVDLDIVRENYRAFERALLLKPDRVQSWYDRMPRSAEPTAEGSQAP